MDTVSDTLKLAGIVTVILYIFGFVIYFIRAVFHGIQASKLPTTCVLDHNNNNNNNRSIY